MCAEARTALAIAVVPYALEAQVESVLFQMMAGACSALAESNCALVGGHTCEGTELALGFCINGVVEQERALCKGGLRAGESLVLTKPIGTGTLFAAEMRVKAKGIWVANALQVMSKSNREGALCLRRHGASACTDVTGFGLVGHLQEMVMASSAVEVDLNMDTIPELPGARECTQMGIFSSLQPANLRLKRAIANEAEALTHPGYPLLFDPQTAGGLLASVPADSVVECIAELRKNGYPHASVIGTVRGVPATPTVLGDDGDVCALSTSGKIHCVL
jgi:selenide,water dikinase